MAFLPSKPTSDAEFRANQRAFGLVFLVGAILLTLMVGSRISFDGSRITEIDIRDVGMPLMLLSIGIGFLYVSRKR